MSCPWNASLDGREWPISISAILAGNRHASQPHSLRRPTQISPRYASKLVARDTASIIADHLRSMLHNRRALNQADAGPWQGLTPEIKEQWPGFLERNRRPDGLSRTTRLFSGRLRPTELLGSIEPNQPTIVVTHSGVIRSLRRHLTGAGTRPESCLWLHLVRGRASWT